MVLTHANYHSPENTCITNSKVGDFLLSKEYYRAKHVDRTLVDEPSNSMLVGAVTDAIFSGLDHESMFTKDKKADDGRLYVQQSLYDKGVEIGKFIVAQDFYRWYSAPSAPGRRTVFQKPLSGRIVQEFNGKKIAVPIAAMPDALTFDEGDEDGPTVYVDDLKTSRNWDMASPENWHRKCAGFGYYRQFAVMGQLAADKFKAARRIVFRHIVVGTTKEGTWRVKLFVVPQAFLEAPWREFVSAAFAISMEKAWLDPAIGWNGAVELPAELARFAAKPAPDEDGFQEV